MNTTEFKKLRNVVRQQLAGIAAIDSRWYDVISASNLAEQYHVNTRKDNITPEIYHQYSMAGFALSMLPLLGNVVVEVLVTIFLHDTIEDYPETRETVFTEFSKYAKYVDGMSKVTNNITIPNSEYYETLSSNIVLSIVKGIDRIHNMSTIKHLGTDKTTKYIIETREYVLPMLKLAKLESPRHTMILEHLKSILNIICESTS